MFLAVAAVVALTLLDPKYHIELPPPQYDGAPPLSIVVKIGVSLFEADRVCRLFGVRHFDPPIWGCSIVNPAWCLIISPRGVPADFLALIDRHEEAHCAGWRH